MPTPKHKSTDLWRTVWLAFDNLGNVSFHTAEPRYGRVV